MSNRFYRAAGEENSDTEEDNSNESGSDEEVQQKAAPVKAKPAAKPKADEEESDDESAKGKARQVVSAKEKKMAALLSAMKALRNALKIGNWVKVLSGWDEIEVHVAKLAKEPEFRKEGIPKVYWQQMLALDALIRKQKEDEKKAKAGDDDGDDVKGVDKKAPKPAAPKKMNAEQARAQTRLHSNLKKLIKQHETKIEEYKKSPLADDAKLEDAAAAAGAGDDAKPKKAAKAAPAAAAAAAAADDGEGEADDGEGEGDENEDGDEGEDTKEDSDAEWADSDDEKGEAVDLTKKEAKWFNREFWMKKPGAPDSDDEAERKRKPTTKRRQGTGKKPVDIIPTNVADEKKTKDADFTPELIMKKLNELVGMRGKKGTDRKAMIADLQLLATKTVEPAPLLKVLITLCSALFDITLNADTHMPIDSWSAAHKTLLDIIKILDKEALVRLSEDDTAVEESFEQGENEDQKLVEKFIVGASAAKVEEEAKKKAEEEKALKAQGKEMQYVMGNLYSFVDRMASEFKKSLQNIDPHTPDYVARLKHEPLLLELIEKVQAYYFKIQKITFQCKVVLLRLEHVYYRYNPAEDVQRPDAQAYSAAVKAGKALPTPSSAGAAGVAGVARTPFGARGFLNLENPSEVQQFATFLYKHADDRSRMRALLYHVFYLSIHNRYAEARDLLLMSHVQDGINDVDIYTRIIFNRTMAQLGLCAFRVGEYRHSLYCLMDLHQSKSIKELIAQGTSSRYFGDRDIDKERIERKRVYPYHQHMSLDVLESVHLLSAMFIEVPNLAIYGADNKRRIISKPFRRLFDHHQRQAFNGPPENTRDLIMAATKALRTGEWSRALKLVMRLKMWELIPNAEYVKSMVTDKIKEEALRTYLFTYATQYVTISLHTLMTTFDLNAQAVYRITSKMMINEQLAGTWDQPTASIVMHAQEPTPLQRAALKFADKAGVFLEQNERVGEQRASLGSGEGSGERRSGYGGYGSGYQRAGGDGEHHGEGGRRNYRGGGGRGRFPSSRLRGGRGGGGGGGGERHSAAADD